MTVLDLENLNKGTWFPYESGSEICLRTCAAEDLRDIVKKSSEKKARFTDRARIEWEEPDEDKRFELLYDFCIVDWKGFFDKDEKPIPCTKEMKLLLMGKSVEFARKVGELLKQMSETEEVYKADQEKN